MLWTWLLEALARCCSGSGISKTLSEVDRRGEGERTVQLKAYYGRPSTASSRKKNTKEYTSMHAAARIAARGGTNSPKRRSMSRTSSAR